MNDPDPYSAPLSNLEPPRDATDDGFLGEARRVPVDSGMAGLRTGWEYFQQAPGAWLGIIFVFMVIYVAASMIPFVGGFIAIPLMMVLLGGVALCCDLQRRGRVPELSNLFDGFGPARNPLLLVSVVYLVATIVATVLVMVVMFAGMGGLGAFTGQGQDPDPAVMVPMIAVLVVLALGLFIPLGMAIWFAPYLVAINGMAPIDAMKSSFQACLRNLVATIVYGVLGFLVTLVAIIPCGLGLLVTGPVMMIATFAAYRDMYYAD